MSSAAWLSITLATSMDGVMVQTPLSLPGWVKVAAVVIAAVMVLNFIWNVGWSLYQRRYPMKPPQ
jgi:hypothetical protein